MPPVCHNRPARYTLGMDNTKKDIVRCLLDRNGGMFSRRLGIDLDGGEPAELFRWLVASLLYGAPISAGSAERTYGKLVEGGIDSPHDITGTGWEGLVKLLDAGGYTRYDFKTADKLIEVSGNLERMYEGDLNRLHDVARDGEDLKVRIKALGKGVGDVTANIFLRELRGVWPKATPELSPYAELAARETGLAGEGEDAPTALMTAWGRGLPGRDFRDLEAALVSEGIALRRHGRAKKAA